MAILENQSGQFNPWLPKEMDMVVTILDEFKAPTSDKTKSPLVGNVEWEGKEYSLTLCTTNWSVISASYGKDTKDWVGQQIAYKGIKPMGQGKGHWWEAV